VDRVFERILLLIVRNKSDNKEANTSEVPNAFGTGNELKYSVHAIEFMHNTS